MYVFGKAVDAIADLPKRFKKTQEQDPSESYGFNYRATKSSEVGLDSEDRSSVGLNVRDHDTHVARHDRNKMTKTLASIAGYLDNAVHGKFDISEFRHTMTQEEHTTPMTRLRPIYEADSPFSDNAGHAISKFGRRAASAFTDVLDDDFPYEGRKVAKKPHDLGGGVDRSTVRDIQQTESQGSAHPGTPVAAQISAQFHDLPPPYQTLSEEIVETIGWIDNNHHPQAVDDFSAAIEARDSPSARTVFENNKAAIVSQHQYEWIEEVLDAGYSTTEFIDLMIEEKTQSPWIYYDPPSLEAETLDIGLHQSDCVHKTTSGKIDGTLQINSTEEPGCRQAISRLVAEMCGLAGLIPSTGGPSTWNGNAAFEPDRWHDSALAAAVSYGSHTPISLMPNSELRNLAQNSLDALNRALSVAIWLRNSGLICDKYTILTQSKPQVVEVVSIHLELLESLQDSMRWVLEATNEEEEYFLRVCAEKSCDILVLVFPGILLDLVCSSWRYTVDCCALAVQSICIGLLGFSNAHLGKWHPFFLEHDLTEVRLCGVKGPLCQEQEFCVRLTELSCIVNMLKSPVRIFTMGHAAVTHGSKCDLLTSIVDLLEMWGPGQVIIDRNVVTEENICLVKIGDGVLYKTADKSRRVLHWVRETTSRVPHDQVCFDKNKKLLIGLSAPLATLNTDCPLSHTATPHQNLNQFYTNSMIHELGTWAAYWDQTERQAGLQGGNFIFGVINLTWVKNGSETIKKRKLRGAQFDLQFLEAPWGLQVSACTGVAQRVPLREVVAEAMVPMVEAWGNRPDEWTELSKTHGIVDQFRSPAFVSWFNDLDGQRRLAVVKIAKHVLAHLSYTGFSDRGELVLAYPVPDDAFACVHIPCKKEQLWTRILKDSQDCATFACITSRCLETPDHKCRNSPSAGLDQPVLLVTAVCQYHRAQSGTWEKMVQQELQNGNTYWMGEPGNEMEFKARLQSPSTPGSAKVVEIRASQIPAKLRQRMIATRLLTSGRSIRLQERRKVNEEYAEDVFVSGDQLRLGTRSGPPRKKADAVSGSGKGKELRKGEPLISPISGYATASPV